MDPEPQDAVADFERAFIEAACVPRKAHSSGGLEDASALLAAYPDIARRGIHTAAILGDGEGVRRFLALDPKSASGKAAPYGWDALTCLCFSRYLRLDRARSDGFLQAARALLDAGADPNSGFCDESHKPDPEFESVLYGASGIAHHEPLTRLLLERGADPNNIEVVYHTPESYDNGSLKALVETGKLTSGSLAVMLLRKHDWHDYEGIRYLLEHGADPNCVTPWGRTALHQAVLRDNAAAILDLSLDHGADPTLLAGGQSAIGMAARRGRGDVLALFERRGIPAGLHGLERLLAACAKNEPDRIASVLQKDPDVLRDLRAEGGKVLAEFAGNGNTEGVRHLLDLGIEPAALFQAGDGYWDVAKDSTALHVAAWRARHATVKLLIERGAPVNVVDGKGRTALALAVRACVDSYWTQLRSPESVQSLVRADAALSGVQFPSGYAEVDEVLRRSQETLR